MKRMIPLLALTVLLVVGSGMSSAHQDKPKIGRNVGEMYPDFVLPTIDGKEARLSDFRGKKVFLFNFASW